MTISLTLAVTWFGKETRFLGLDWSWIMLIGLAGNITFSMRFLIQWLESEKKGESVIPRSFWYWSIGGSVLMCTYFILRRDPMGILGYLPNTFIYVRNLRLIRKRRALRAALEKKRSAKEASGVESPTSGT